MSCSTETRPPWVAPLVAAVQGLHSTGGMRPPADGTGRKSAVLVALSETEDGPGVLLIERATGLRNHSGQAAFPGGSVDPTDADTTATALREAQEEVGLDVSSVDILATFPASYIPPTGFIVTPVLAWWARPHPIVVIDAYEVARAVVVSLEELADPANRFMAAYPGATIIAPAFAASGLFIWGFTARVLDELLRLGGWEQPWDRADVRPLPVPPTPPLLPTPPLPPVSQ